jgi:hypothetical protein
MSSDKPRVRAAIAYARNFAAGLIDNAEPGWIQDQTNLTEEEGDIVTQELQRIKERLEKTINREELAKVSDDPEGNEDE